MGIKDSKIESEKDPIVGPLDETLLKIQSLLNQNVTFYYHIQNPTVPFCTSEHCFIENDPENAISFGFPNVGILSDTLTNDYESIKLMTKDRGFINPNQNLYDFHGFTSLHGKGYVIHYPWTVKKVFKVLDEMENGCVITMEKNIEYRFPRKRIFAFWVLKESIIFRNIPNEMIREIVMKIEWEYGSMDAPTKNYLYYICPVQYINIEKKRDH